MTPYEHIWAWAKSLKVEEMDAFIAKYENHTVRGLGILYKGVWKTHAASDLLEAVRFCREEYRKDQRMEIKGEE